jgi:lysophospholipase L1-like esterase
VIYHVIGVNGAKFSDYSRAKYFAKQVADLNPDLIILSFGTNEAQANPDPAYLSKTMKDLVNGLEEACGGARFLLTTPADSYLRGKGFNPYLPEVSTLIRRFAKSKGFAYGTFTNSGGARIRH